MQRVNECIAQLREMTSWNSFAASLVAQYDSKGSLSVRQVEAAERMFAKMADNAANKNAAKSVDLTSVHKMFDAALSNGLTTPRFHFGDIKLSVAPPSGVNRGAVYVKVGGEYAGKIVAGSYHPVGQGNVATAQAIATIAADPLAAAIEHGHATKRCACCGKLLTDDKNKGSDGLTSIVRGIGPICARNWGLL